MRPTLTAVALLLALSAAVTPARAQVVAQPDSGRLLVFVNERPVANERYWWEPMGDSILISADHRFSESNERGERRDFRKVMTLVLSSRDLGLLRYFSRQDYGEDEWNRGILPGDTAMTYYHELNGGGSAERLTMPPGRLYVMDSRLFTLFDVVCRSLAYKQFEKRPLQTLSLFPDSLATIRATVTLAGVDTMRTGTRRVAMRRYRYEDPSIGFDLWADLEGRLMRLDHTDSGLSVRLDLPAPAATPAKRRAVPAKPAPTPSATPKR